MTGIVDVIRLVRVESQNPVFFVFYPDKKSDKSTETRVFYFKPGQEKSVFPPQSVKMLTINIVRYLNRQRDCFVFVIVICVGGYSHS